jgi:NitT/TauT family transport system substrate-binding protein
VTIQDISNGGDAIVAKPEIKKLQDLKGRRVGVESTALGAFELSRALEQVGMTPKDVKIVSLLVSQDEQAFKQGSIDAIVTYEPTVSKLRAMGANLLFDSSQIPGEVLDILAMRESVVTKQPATAQALTTGWFRALDYLQKHPSDAARRMASHEGVTPLQFLKSLNSIRIPDVESNQKILGKTDAASIEAVSRLAKFMGKKNLLKKSVDPTSVFDARLVDNVDVSIFKNK